MTAGDPLTPAAPASGSTAELAQNRQLVDRIRQAIGSSPDQCIDFAQFMELALYEPELGYYMRARSPIGFPTAARAS